MQITRCAALLASLLATRTEAVDPLVTLPYASYQGVDQGTGVSQWLGIRFAAPPTGNRRFHSPQDPLREESIIQANKHGKYCLPVGGALPSNKIDEDCLFLDVYAPTNITSPSGLPVFVFIQGGGFASNANPNLNGTGLVQASGQNIIVVTFNYRVGPYGFLASQEVVNDGHVNNGFKDQRKALEWVQKYISKFGGNPKHVVIGGDSAGGQSIALHLAAYGGRDEGFFVGAAGESISSPTMYTVAGSQATYDSLVNRTGCAGNDTLSCLRGLNVTALQKQNFVTPLPGRVKPPLFTYGPTVDGSLIPDVTYQLFTQGRFIKVPTILGADTNDGTMFAPKSASSYNDTDQFLLNNFPYLSTADLSRIRNLYPVADYPSNYSGAHQYWQQAAAAYGDLRYKCPGTFFSTSLAAQNTTSNSTGTNVTQPLAAWNYRYNVQDDKEVSEGLGVPHTVEVNAIFGPTNIPGHAPASYYPGKANAPIVPEIQAYWTSFIRTLNPNTYRLNSSAEWEQWTGASQSRLVFQVQPSTVMERVSSDDMARCAFYNGIGIRLHQ